MIIDHSGAEPIMCTGRREGTATATWGQRYIWDIIKSLEPVDEHLNAAFIERVPPGRKLADALSAIASLISEHDTFRTRYRLTDGDRLVQDLERELTIDVEICHADSLGSDEELFDEFGATIRKRFDTGTGPMVRAAVVLHRNEPVRVLFAMCHMVSDLWGASLIRHRLRGLLAGRRGPQPTACQPFDQAAYEATEAARRENQNALAYWRDCLPAFPERYPGEGGHQPEPLRYRSGVLHSPRAFAAAQIVAQRNRISVPAVLTGAFARMLARATGLPRVPFLVRTNNRIRPAALDGIGHFAQRAPLVVDADGPFDEVVRRTYTTAFLAYRHGAYDPADLARQTAADDRRSGPPALTMTMNCMVGPEDERPSGVKDRAALDDSRFVWAGGRETEHVSVYCDAAPSYGVLQIFVDTAFIERARAEALLWQLDEELARAAHGDARCELTA